MSEKQFTLSQLAASLQTQVAKIYAGQYWIIAEISKLNAYPQSGHCYPLLVEKRQGQIVAEMKGFIGKGIFGAINSRFGAETGKTLSDGMQVLFRCKLSYHPVFGLSLNILDIEPGFSLGEMARMRQQTIANLRKKGIFDANKQKSLPLLPKRLAVISVLSSKGYRDFISVLEAHPFGKAIQIKLYPALLQGDSAVESIATALRSVAASARDYDAVAIIRGGGGETGLDCYDQYPLAEAVSLFPIPVLSGIGHATNLTVVEQVSHTNLITPTDLARWLLSRFERVDLQLAEAGKRLRIFRKGKFELLKRDLSVKASDIANLSRNLLTSAQSNLGSRSYQVSHQSKERLILQKALLARITATDLPKSQAALRVSNQLKLAKLHHTLLSSAEEVLRSAEDSIHHLSEKLELLKPEKILKRGYSITLANGKPIKDSSKIKIGSKLQTQTSTGIVHSEVIKNG